MLPEAGSGAAQAMLLSKGFLPGRNRSRKHGLKTLPALLLALGKVPVEVREVSGCFQAVGYLPTMPLPQLSPAFITSFP